MQDLVHRLQEHMAAGEGCGSAVDAAMGQLADKHRG
jgi:uncharacterized protein YoaH (UPF0181 family)